MLGRNLANVGQCGQHVIRFNTRGMKVNETKKPARARNASLPHVSARCLCGAVELEVAVPVFWAWHDHSAATRRAHGAAYATYGPQPGARGKGS